MGPLVGGPVGASVPDATMNCFLAVTVDTGSTSPGISLEGVMYFCEGRV